MDVSSVGASNVGYTSTASANTNTNTNTNAGTAATTTPKLGEDAAAVFEKSTDKADDGKKTYTVDKAEVQRLIDESNRQTKAFVEMIQKMMAKQAGVAGVADGSFTEELLGKLTTKYGQLDFHMSKSMAEKLASYADDDTIKWAQEQISDDGYYGVEKTSDRLVAMAKALSGGDPSKVDLMRGAIEKGFKAAEQEWGDKLPDIAQKTYDATMKKLDEWAASGKTDANAAAPAGTAA